MQNNLECAQCVELFKMASKSRTKKVYCSLKAFQAEGLEQQNARPPYVDNLT